MPKQDSSPRNAKSDAADRKALIGLLNEDLAREYQAIIAYVVYSQVLKGAAYMSIAKELEVHAREELDHALIIAKQIDYLGGTLTVTPKPVKLSDKAEALLRFDLENETETIKQYRTRVRQCEALGEYAMAEHIREILKAGTGAPDRPGDRAGRGSPGYDRLSPAGLTGGEPRRGRQLPHHAGQCPCLGRISCSAGLGFQPRRQLVQCVLPLRLR